MTQQQYAMRISGLSLIAIGILFAVSVLPILHPVVRVFLQIAYWPMHSVPAELAIPVPLLVAISGGLTAGLGGMLWALGTHVAEKFPEAAAKVTQIAAWSWFCTDSTASIMAQAPFNVVLNLAFLAVMLISSRVRTVEATKAA